MILYIEIPLMEGAVGYMNFRSLILFEKNFVDQYCTDVTVLYLQSIVPVKINVSLNYRRDVDRNFLKCI